MARASLSYLVRGGDGGARGMRGRGRGQRQLVLRAAALILAVALGGCRKNEPQPTPIPVTASAPSASAAAGPAPCPPSTIAIRGAPFTPRSARAYGFAGFSGTYVIVLSDHDISCEVLLSGARSVAKNEDYLDVGVGKTANIQQYVDAYNTMANVKTELLLVPHAPGDPIDICIREPAHLAIKDSFASGASSVDAVGLVHGTYCGDVK